MQGHQPAAQAGCLLPLLEQHSISPTSSQGRGTYWLTEPLCLSHSKEQAQGSSLAVPVSPGVWLML